MQTFKMKLATATILAAQFVVLSTAVGQTRTSAPYQSKKHPARMTQPRSVPAPGTTVLPTVNSAQKRVRYASADEAETVIVTGTHASNRTARSSTSPVTVISAATLQHSGQLNLADALVRTYPSITVQNQGADAAALTSSVRMRGLGPNQVLVLVDGKRRHTTANIQADGGPNFGATPVDLNMIPANAIDHIEVLEDGAAAMYGSDAIAGVVNIITKKQDHGLNVSGQTGANAYNGDGWQYQLNADGGMKLGDGGYLHISGQMYHTDHWVMKNIRDHRLLPAKDLPPNIATNGYYTSVVANPVNVPETSNQIESSPEETRENLAIDWGKKITEHMEIYGQITYAHRHSEAYENYRTPAIAPSIYPSGFSPLETIEENDFAGQVGLKGDNFFGFDYDLSTTYGEDDDDVGNKNTANPGMLASTCSTNAASAYYSIDGCGWSPTTVRAESYKMGQWTNNADFRRRFNIGHVVPMTLAMGAEHRLETYSIRAGNPPSYQLGGTQGYAGLQPQDAGKWSRDIWAGYIDGDFHLLPHWDLDFAGRHEHYTDFGNTDNGKVSTRWDITRRIAVRATISNGFRAPTMAEQHFSAMNVGPTSASGLLPVSSEAARLMGASPLKPERSTSESGGIVVEPINGLHVEADVYQINIRDRIVQGGTTRGLAAVAAIESMGFQLPANGGIDPQNVSAYYFANGASTRTQGVDIKADYMFHLHRWGNLALSAAINLNRTRLHHNGIGSNGQQLLTQATVASLTTASPRSKIILNAHWTIENWDVNVRQSRYGSTTSLLSYSDWTPSAMTCPDGTQARYSNSCWAEFKGTAAWLTDLEIGYRFNRHWHVAVGANDIFNVRPRMIPMINNGNGVAPFTGSTSGISMMGGYYYGRVNVTF